MIHTNRCKHCGLTKEQHEPIETSDWEDSGLAALDAHKEELYEATQKLIKAIDELDITSGSVATENIRTILNQIEKEK